MATTAARAVCLARDLELPHVWEAAGAYLDHSSRWSIERAAAKGFKFLVQHLALQSEHETASAALGKAADANTTAVDGDVGDANEDPARLPHSLVMDFAASNGHLEILQWLHGNATLSRCSTRAMDDAAKNGHLGIVQWLHAYRTEGCTVKAMDYAAKNGHLDVVKWLHAHREEGCTKKAMDFAAMSGHLDVLEWLGTHRQEGCSRLAVEHAAASGHLHIVRWLCEHRKLECSPSAVVKAARHGHVHILEYIHRFLHGLFEAAGAKMVHAAIANGHVELMTWLISVLPVTALKCEGTSYSWLDVAAESGQVGILQWFVDHSAELPVGVQVDGHLLACSAEAIEKAAGNGHISVLQFLHEQEMVDLNNEDDAVKALAAAVQGGHASCVEWILTHCRQQLESAPSAPTAIMDTAAAAGHIGILRFLRDHSITSEWKTSAKAVNEAARQGRIDILHWLHTNEDTTEEDGPGAERWTPRALEMAAANGHLTVVQWIVTHRCVACRSAEALNAAAYMDHTEIARYLHAHIRSSCSVVQAIEHAEEGGADETLEWLHSLDAADQRP